MRLYGQGLRMKQIMDTNTLCKTFRLNVNQCLDIEEETRNTMKSGNYNIPNPITFKPNDSFD